MYKIKKNLFFLIYPLFIFSQNENDTLVEKNKLIKFDDTKKNANSKVFSNNTFSYCDTDSDGFLEIDLNEIGNYTLSETINQFGYEEGILISSNGDSINLVSNINTSPTISTVCNTSYSSIYDIAVNQNDEIFILYWRDILKLNDLCSMANIFDFDLSGFPNSLSFDRLNNLYFGGFNSIVYRLNNGDYSQMTTWHDFNSGYAGGDFVMYNEKMYIAWRLNGNYKLYEVTVDSNNNYLSHIDLGTIPDKTYGLASELGSLYGITPSKLYKINLPNLTFETILNNTSGYDWYGAAGKNEAKKFDIKIFESLSNAQNNINSLPAQWTNTVSGGQTIFVAITEALSNQNIIVPVNIVVNIPPTYNNPIKLNNCLSDPNPFTFNIRQTENYIIGNQSNIILDYYSSQIDADNNINNLPDIITLTANSKVIYVKLTNSITNCSSNFNFNLEVLNPPSYNQPNDIILCNSKSIINILFDPNSQTQIITKNQQNENLTINYYKSISDANDGINPLSNTFLVTSSFKEIFFRIEDVFTNCYSIGSFNINVLQENFNNYISFQIENQEWTDNNNKIKIITENQELYNYSLDGINYQLENFFENLLPGEYNVFVKNIITCEFNQKNVLVLMYPLFFTPNNDGVNDIWHIKDAEKENRIQVSIFDRYGKLIKKLNSNDVGWDGTNNNQKLPADDYWFIVNRENGKTFKGHFTLKR